MNRVIKEKIIIVGTVFSDRRFKYTQRLEEIARATEVTDPSSETEDEEVAQFSDRNNHPIAPPPPRFSSPIDNYSGNITPFLASNGKILPIDPYLTSIGTPDFEKELYNMKSFDRTTINGTPSETTSDTTSDTISETSSESSDEDEFRAPREDVRN